ncbi:MAG: TIGR01244 family sulfur transferase [Pseudomonadota bacterium]
MFRKIDDSISVAPQISVADVQAAADQGFTMIINNRPDEEEPGQVPGDDIREAARAAGLAYVAIPISHGGFSANQVDAMRDALANAGGPVLAFCRSGTRSTLLWALAKGADGVDADALLNKAAGAGYDISSIKPLLGPR